MSDPANLDPSEPEAGDSDTQPARLGRMPLVLLFALALVLRIGTAIDYAHHHPTADHPGIDEESYEDWAREIAGGDWLGDEVFFQEPLYPYWLGTIHALWSIGAEPADRLRRARTASRHIQSLYGAIAAVLVACVGARLFGRRAGLIAGVLAAIYRPLVFFPALFLKPNLVVPLIALLPLCFVWMRGAGTPRARLLRAGALGLLAGLGALLRGNLLLLVPAFVALPVLRAARGRAWRQGLSGAAAVALGVALVLVPVALRNHAVGGVFALTTSGAGTNLYGGNNAENPYGLATEFTWVRGVPEHEADDWRHEAERRTGRLLDAGEVSSYWIGETLRSLRADPGLHASILWNKLRLTLGAYEVPDNHHLAWDAKHVSALRAPLFGFGLWGAAGLAGLLAFVLRRFFGREGVRDADGAWELAGLFALYTVTIVLTVTSMRIRLALVPMLLPFAGYLIDLGLRRRWAVAVPTAAALLVVHWPVIPPALRADDMVERDFNLAVHLLEVGDLDGVEAVLADLETERPGTVQVALIGAELAYRRGLAAIAAGASRAEFEPILDRALALLRPVATGADVAPRDRFRAQKLAALVQFDNGDWAVAERRSREALAFDPSDRDLRLRLANALWMQAPGGAGQERLARLSEARALIEGLLAEDEDETLRAFLEAVEAALNE